MRRFFRVPVSSVVIATLERELTKLPLPQLEARPQGNKTFFMLNGTKYEIQLLIKQKC